MPQPSSPLGDTYAHSYVSLLQTYASEYQSRLEQIVNIDSGSGHVEGVQRVAGLLETWLTELGMDVTSLPTPSLGASLLARRKGKGQLRLLLVGHIDTVYPVGSIEKQPFQVKENVAYGPGVIDMKSGVLMGLYTIRALIERGNEDYSELLFFINTDEELGSPASTPQLREIAKEVDYALVLEPSRSSSIVTHARKGTERFYIEVQGIPAHSGAEPHKGRSAVLELAHLIVTIQNYHSLFQGVTFNVANLQSSDRLNVIPEFASCALSVRAYRPQDLEKAAEYLTELVAHPTIPGTKATIRREHGRVPYEPTPEIRWLVDQAVLEGRSLNLGIVAETKGGVSDANVLVGAGVPTLDSLGPTGGNMHDLQHEHLFLASFPERGALLAGMVQRVSRLGKKRTV